MKKIGIEAMDVSAVDREFILWWLLQQTSTIIFNARERELREFGISPIQAAILYIMMSLGESPTPAEIARRVLRKPHSVSQILNRMEKAGLVTRSH
ncbi:MarR family winged helix-turn-helix transcriptional regulator, partial [Chloroflexota bacterium]